MKFLVVGLGSMGKRRIRNFLALGERDVVGVDVREDRCRQVAELFGVQTFMRLEEGFALDPDAVVISMPPDLHVSCALLAVRHGKHFFTEVGVPDDGLEELEREVRQRRVVAAPSCTMRFHPAIRKAKEIIDSGAVGSVLAFTHHFGEHLRRWHPGEDYREFYVSKRHTGACREIVSFELSWLTWLCGDVETVSAFKGQIGSLGVDIDDVYQIILKFRRGCLGHLQVDALQCSGYRQARFVCADGVVAWDWDTRRLVVYGSDGTCREYPDSYTQASIEGFYIDEMATFVRAIRGETLWPYSLSDDRQTLALLTAIEHSAESGVHIEVAR